MDSSTIIPIITTLIVLWVITAAVNDFSIRRKKKSEESALKKTPLGEVSPGLRLIQTISTPFFLLSRAWGKLGFAIMDGGCLFFTLLTGLPLLALIGALIGGALLAPGRVYAAWSSGSSGGVLIWSVLWLFCLIGVPGLLSGIKDAYSGGSRGAFPRGRGRSWWCWLLILTGLGFLFIPVSSRLFPGFLSGESAALSRGAVVTLTAGDKVESTGAAKPDSRPAAGKNLLKNGDFERLRGNMMLGWETDFYGSDKDSVRFYAAKGGAFSGDYYVTIENVKANDGKFVQPVKVKPDTLYKFSCMVKAEVAGQPGKGANITVLGITKTSLDVKDTAGKWKKIVLYGRSGPSQKEITVTARLGGYGAVSKGKASFDDFRVEEVTDVPAGTKPVRLYHIRPVHRRLPGMPVIHAFMVFSPLLFLLFFLLTYYFIFNNREDELADAKLKHLELAFFIILTGAFALRLLLAPVIDGFYTDVNTFKAWAGMAAHRGLAGFYSGEMHVDYPPGYIYILYLVGLLKKLFSLSFESKSFLMMIKMPAMIADMLTAFIIYKLTVSALPGVKKPVPGHVGGGGEKKRNDILIASVLSLFYALNPAVILNSTVWGQVDSFFTLFILLALLLLYKNKFEAAAVIFVIAALLKPQALIFAPVGIYAFIKTRSLKVFLRSFLLMIATFVVLVLPFAVKHPPLWVFDLYKRTLSSYPFASLNAFNLFALNGGNYAKETDIFFIFSYQVWGYIFIAAIVVFSGFLFFKSKDKSRVFFIALFIIAAVFILTSKMHERYIFPVLCLSLVSYIYTRDKRLLFIFAGFTLTHFINTALVLDLVLRVGGDRFPPGNIWLYLVSFINLALLVYTVQTGWDLYLRKPDSALSRQSI